MDNKQDAPWQIVFGLLNPVYCVVCSRALWLELNLNPTALNLPYVFVSVTIYAFLMADSVERHDSSCIYYFVQAQRIQGRGQRRRRGGGEMSMLGRHSIRKYAAVFAQRCGVTKDEKPIRGRWKGAGRVSDMYDDVELPYPDAKVAEKLYDAGLCFYVSDPGRDVTMMNTSVLSRVVPNIRKRLLESACLVLGKALLWLIWSPVADEFIPSDFKRDALLEWEHVRSADFDAVVLNPIKKMVVTVSGNH